MRIQVPQNPHRLFRNWLGCVSGRLTVISYAGKVISNKHCWFVECSCGSGSFIITTTGLCSTKSCGCINIEATRSANTGNNRGAVNIKTRETEEKLKQVKPDYVVTNKYDGKVMSKWGFFCKVCQVHFECRPDNILPRGSSLTGQTPCNCCERGGYSKYKGGTFYIVSAGPYCKFGISNDFEKRLKQLSKSYGKEVELCFIITSIDGRKAFDIEKAIKGHFNYRVNIGNVDGMTEYRHESDKEEMIKLAIGVFANSL